jgi:hypothetical protein
VRSYLRAIRANPEAVEAALWSDAAQAKNRAPSAPAKAGDPGAMPAAAQAEDRVTLSAA